MAGELEQRPWFQRVVDGLEQGRRRPVILGQAAERLLHLPELGIQQLNRILIGAHPYLRFATDIGVPSPPAVKSPRRE